MLTWKQKVGLALEQLTYEIIGSQLRHRLHTVGKERPGLYGPVWEAKNYALYWNMQVVKSGSYPKSGGRKKGTRRRLPDLVLVDNNLPETVPYNQFEPPPLQGTLTKAILAIECKNNNLDYHWGYPSQVKAFDDDIMSRFVWANSTSLNNVERLIRFDVDWERYAGYQNLFPKAVKILLMPSFTWLAKSKPSQRTPLSPAEWLDEAEKLLGANTDPRLIADAAYRLEYDLMPPTFNVRDQIEWRIRRLKLHVLELGCQPTPNKKVPPIISRRIANLLKPYLETLVPENTSKQRIGTKVTKVGHKLPALVEPNRKRSRVSRKKFRLSVQQKELRHLRKLGYEPPNDR